MPAPQILSVKQKINQILGDSGHVDKQKLIHAGTPFGPAFIFRKNFKQRFLGFFLSR